MALTAQNLKEILSYIPDSAIVYSYADHGQMSEQISSVGVTDCKELGYYGEDIQFIDANVESLKSGIIEYEDDEGDVQVFEVDKITAVLIG
jgi:hypothetical protein